MLYAVGEQVLLRGSSEEASSMMGQVQEIGQTLMRVLPLKPGEIEVSIPLAEVPCRVRKIPLSWWHPLLSMTVPWDDTRGVPPL